MGLGNNKQSVKSKTAQVWYTFLAIGCIVIIGTDEVYSCKL